MKTQTHPASELAGFFRDRNYRLLPSVILVSGPSLHFDWMSHWVQHTVVIGIGRVLQVVCPTIWICSKKEDIGDFPIGNHSMIICRGVDLECDLLDRDVDPSLIFCDEDVIQNEPNLVTAVRYAHMLGLRYVHFDGVDIRPSPNGQLLPPNIRMEPELAWTQFYENRTALHALSDDVFSPIHFSSYTPSFSSRRVRLMLPENIWNRRTIR